MERHPMSAARLRNERKRMIFERWVALGAVQINFDATMAEVAVPENFKGDNDYWLQLKEARVYTTHVEGYVSPSDTRIPPFEFSVPWDSVHAIY